MKFKKLSLMYSLILGLNIQDGDLVTINGKEFRIILKPVHGRHKGKNHSFHKKDRHNLEFREEKVQDEVHAHNVKGYRVTFEKDVDAHNFECSEVNLQGNCEAHNFNGREVKLDGTLESHNVNGHKIYSEHEIRGHNINLAESIVQKVEATNCNISGGKVEEIVVHNQSAPKAKVTLNNHAIVGKIEFDAPGYVYVDSTIDKDNINLLNGTFVDLNTNNKLHSSPNKKFKNDTVRYEVRADHVEAHRTSFNNNIIAQTFKASEISSTGDCTAGQIDIYRASFTGDVNGYTIRMEEFSANKITAVNADLSDGTVHTLKIKNEHNKSKVTLRNVSVRKIEFEVPGGIVEVDPSMNTKNITITNGTFVEA